MDWTTDQIQVMRWPESVRRRPGMYVGSTGQDGVQHVVDSVIQNAFAEYDSGSATRVGVRINGSLIEVFDDGDGLPFEWELDRGGTLGEACLTDIRIKWPERRYGSWYGDCGLSAVNALSHRFRCDSWRKGQLWTHKFVRGVPVGNPTIVKDGDGRGTTIQFVLDDEIFGDERADERLVRNRVSDLSYLHEGLIVCLNDEEFLAQNGLSDYVRKKWEQSMLSHEGMPEVFFEEVETESMRLQLAAVGSSETTEWRSWVHKMSTQEHGVHVDACQSCFDAVGWHPTFAALHLCVEDPLFSGRMHERLTGPAVGADIESCLQPLIEKFCRSHSLGRFATNQRFGE